MPNGPQAFRKGSPVFRAKVRRGSCLFPTGRARIKLGHRSLERHTLNEIENEIAIRGRYAVSRAQIDGASNFNGLLAPRSCVRKREAALFGEEPGARFKGAASKHGYIEHFQLLIAE